MEGTIEILNCNNSSIVRWKRHYELLKHKGIYHCPEYIKIFEEHYKSPAELFLFRLDDYNFVYYPYFKRSLKELAFTDLCDHNTSGLYDIVSSWYYGGPLVQTDNSADISKLVSSFRNAFSKYCKESKIVSEFVRFDPNLRNHSYFENSLAINRNRQTVYVDLKQSEENIWANFEGRARTAIRKAQKLGVNASVSNKTAEDIEEFYKIYHGEMERKGAHDHYRFKFSFIKNLIDSLSNNFVLICAEIDNVIFSSGLFIYDNDSGIGHYFLMATKNEYQQYQANNLILHEAILYFKSKNFSILDFQGGREGVYKFKKSFSKKERTTFYTAGVVHDEAVYNELLKCRNLVIDKDNENFFPLYRLKNTN